MAQLKAGTTVGGALVLTVNDNVSDADTVDGKHASEFAPSGFGLGVHLSGLTTADSNLNTLTGMYYSTGVDINRPPGVNDGALFVMGYGSTWVNQLYMDWRTNATYRRKQENGTWSAWVKMVDATGVDTEFRIGGCTLTHNPSVNSLNFTF